MTNLKNTGYNTPADVKTIGILYETIEDAKKTDLPLELLDHWREEYELAAIEKAIQSEGFSTVRIGTPFDLVTRYGQLKSHIDFIVTLSVGFRSRYRQALGAMACELVQIPYTGPDPYAKITGQNKQLLKALLDKFSISTPAWVYIQNDSDLSLQLPPFPLIVKPACEGTSVGINENAVVFTKDALCEYVQYVIHDLGYPAIVEQFIQGKEFKACYIGNETDLWRGLIEDVHDDGTSLGSDFFHYNAKLKRIFKKEKRDFSSPEYETLIKSCDFVFSLFSPADYAVFDIRQDMKGRYYFIDYNLDATLHPEKTLATCCKLHDITYNEMIKKILITSFNRQGIRWR
jgi:D-alanine-D-alanine ligase